MLRLTSTRIINQSLKSFRRTPSANVTITASFSANAPTTVSIPSVNDVIVKLTFIDPSGARRSVPGYVGKNIHETCIMHGIDIGPSSCGGAVETVQSDTWTEPLYGEGTGTGFDHVLLTGNGVETAKPMDWVEKHLLETYWDDEEIFPESRLASQVVLTKAMDGMIVYVPDRLVDDCP